MNITQQIRNLRRRWRRDFSSKDDSHQDLNLYWDQEMAERLDTWGQGNAWREIQFLLAGARGKVLDIACGTGSVMELLSPFTALELHGIDISDFLINKARVRGIAPARLCVGDATQMPFENGQFDYGYSIGSLEHFTKDGIRAFLKENRRVVNGPTFHMIPVSRKDSDEGWLKTVQSFHNNSVKWWLELYQEAYPRVLVLDSSWNDSISVGKWFVCLPAEN